MSLKVSASSPTSSCAVTFTRTCRSPARMRCAGGQGTAGVVEFDSVEALADIIDNPVQSREAFRLSLRASF